MAQTRGCFGVIQVGSAVDVGELTAWDFAETAAEIDTSAMGDCTASSIAGAVKTTGNMSVSWDSGDAGQALMIVGETVAMDVNPAGLSAGESYSNPAVLILSKAITSSVDDVVKTDYTYSINGAWTVAANP
jgi:hypothetical protein